MLLFQSLLSIWLQTDGWCCLQEILPPDSASGFKLEKQIQGEMHWERGIQISGSAKSAAAAAQEGEIHHQPTIGKKEKREINHAASDRLTEHIPRSTESLGTQKTIQEILETNKIINTSVLKKKIQGKNPWSLWRGSEQQGGEGMNSAHLANKSRLFVVVEGKGERDAMLRLCWELMWYLVKMAYIQVGLNSTGEEMSSLSGEGGPQGTWVCSNLV